MPPRTTPQDPYAGSSFRVELDGVAVASFSQVAGLGGRTQVIEYRTGDMLGGARKLPGRTSWENIVLERGVSADRSLWDWYQTVVQGNVERKNGSVVLLDAAQQVVLRWLFHNAWPCAYVGPTLDAHGHGLAVELLELAHEGLQLDT